MDVVRWSLVAGSLLGGVAVAAGAFGAHGLEDVLASTGQADHWETACRYGMYHALALLAVGLVAERRGASGGLATGAAACFLGGTIIFSGCLATLALSGWRLLGAIVPVGGTLLIAGWALLACVASRSPGGLVPPPARDR